MSDDIAALLVLARSLDKSATTMVGAKTEFLADVATARKDLLAAVGSVRQAMVANANDGSQAITAALADAARTIDAATRHVVTSVAHHEAAAIAALRQFNANHDRLEQRVLASVDQALTPIAEKWDAQADRLEQAATTGAAHAASVHRSIRRTAPLVFALACLPALIAAGIAWASLGWQRSQVDDLKAQRTALAAQIDADTAQLAKLKLRGGDLEWSTCTEDRGVLRRDRNRRCIRMARDLAVKKPPMTFGSGDAQYFVPEGY